jgi:diguanylate cyclase (GGDEF)-like protein
MTTVWILAGILAFGVLQLAAGVLLGRALAERFGRLGKRQPGQSSLAKGLPLQAPASPASDLELRQRLCRLVADVRDELGSHRQQIDRLARRLLESPAADPQELARTFLEAVARSLEINQWLRDRLATAEEKLRVQTAQLEEIAVQARTDPLTGLWNRRTFQAALADKLRTFGHGQPPLALFLIDLDHFKCINDQLGHPVGDLLLQDVARRLSRLSDGVLAARVGGEEFALVVSDDAFGRLEELARRLHQDLRGPVQTPAGPCRYTVSAGLALAKAGESPDELYHRADQALYAAKRAGRNCVVLWDEGAFRILAGKAGAGSAAGSVPGEAATSVMAALAQSQRPAAGAGSDFPDDAPADGVQPPAASLPGVPGLAERAATDSASPGRAAGSSLLVPLPPGLPHEASPSPEAAAPRVQEPAEFTHLVEELRAQLCRLLEGPDSAA